MKPGFWLALATSFALAGCSADEKAEPAKKTTSISGVVLFAGTPPPAREVALPSNLKRAFPSGLMLRPYDVDAAGELADVIVHVTNPPSAPVASPRPEVLLTISNTVCHPRTLAVLVDQPVRIRTAGEPVMLNLNSTSTAGNAFNVALPRSGAESVRKFQHPELAVRLMDNAHPWLSADVAVFTHPWFAVTDRQGRFELPPLPRGRYTVEAYHRRAGRSQMTIEVSGEEARLQFSLPDAKSTAQR